MMESIQRSGAWQGEIWNRRKNGEIYPGWLRITAVKDEVGRLVNYVATLIDITQRKSAEKEINNLAFYDPLTALLFKNTCGRHWVDRTFCGKIAKTYGIPTEGLRTGFCGCACRRVVDGNANKNCALRHRTCEN